MAINLSNALAGLSVLSGSNSVANFQAAQSAIDSVAVTQAKKAFTLPETSPPWYDPENASPFAAQIAEIKRKPTIIDVSDKNGLDELPDVQASFTTYKALASLQLLAESAAKKATSAIERASLQRSFAKGITDLQNYLAKVDTDKLSLSFGQSSSRVTSMGVDPIDSSSTLVATAINKARDAAISGLAGSEKFSITLKRGSVTEVVTVDLARTPQPPTLDSIADAFNAAIAATPVLDGNGAPVLDANGNPKTQWESRFSVEKTGGKWGLAFKSAGIERAAIDQVGAADALMIASGRTPKDGPTSAQIFRIDDPANNIEATRLNTINAVNTYETNIARAAAAAKKAAQAAQSSVPTIFDPAAPKAAEPIVYAATTARAIVTDAEGFSYVVGTTAGDMGGIISDGRNDLYITKVDSEGSVVWQRSLGKAGSAEGAAISLTADGDIVVGGSVSGAFNGGDDSQTDMVVARFSASGTQRFATSIRQIGNENATAITTGADGSIYLAGRASTGGGDAVVLRVDASGKLQERRTINSGGSDTITALAMGKDGQLLALTKQGADTVLLQLDAQRLSSTLGSVTLGAVDARAIAVAANGEIAIAGATTVPVAGGQANTISGGRDAFVTRIGADLSSSTTSYIGTAKEDQADSVLYLGDALYVGGRTSGQLGNMQSGKVDGFVAKINLADGSVGSVSQWGLVAHSVEPVKIAVATGGATVLSALGLSRGSLTETPSALLSDKTSLKEGDVFKVKVDGGAAKTITIGKDETMVSLALKIQKQLGRKGTASTVKLNGKQVLQITAKADHVVELVAGDEGGDVLSKLGMAPGRLVTPKAADPKAPKVTPGGSYSLNLSSTLNLNNLSSAAAALAKVKSAVSMTQSAYRSLYWDSTKSAKVDGVAGGSGGSAYQQARLAQYQAALSRLSG